jgi:hypothetical protein
MRLVLLNDLIYKNEKVFIGSESNVRIRIHLCNKDNHHLYGFYLFSLDAEGYHGDPSIGGYWEVDQLLDLNPGGKLAIIGFDCI